METETRSQIAGQLCPDTESPGQSVLRETLSHKQEENVMNLNSDITLEIERINLIFLNSSIYLPNSMKLFCN